jgi:hypothetical protein
MDFRFDGIVINAIGQALPGVLVYVCTQPATTTAIPPSPLASLFTDSTGATPLANPITVDGNGNFFFYAASAFYTLVYHDPSGRIPDQIYPDQAVLSNGSGTVTSVALSMPTEFSVAGSPVTSTGTLAVTKAVQNILTVYSGPVSGSAAVPTFKTLSSLLTALGVGVGTVTSVALSVSPGSLLSGSVGGSPITAAGTLALTIGIANQAAHFFLAGPASGSSSGATTSRAIVPGDLPGQTALSFSATPSFNASAAASFLITLTADVTSSSVINPTTGQIITFVITQDGTGSHSFTWPTNFKGASNIGSEANSVSVQSFIYAATAWRATGPGSVNES